MDDSIALMVDAINPLTELEKLVLSLRYVEECTMVEIANILDIPRERVTIIAHHAMSSVYNTTTYNLERE